MSKEYKGAVAPATIGFSEPGDPEVDFESPMAIQFLKPVFVAGKQLPGVDLKQEKSVRVKFDFAHQLVWLRVDTGSSIGVAVTPMANLHSAHFGLNAKSVGGPPVSQNPDVVRAASRDPSVQAPRLGAV